MITPPGCNRSLRLTKSIEIVSYDDMIPLSGFGMKILRSQIPLDP